MRTVKELLQFARPSERQSEVLDVNAVLRGTLRMMAGRLARTGLVVEECLAPVLPPADSGGCRPLRAGLYEPH